jgi:peptidyl-dipeptidase Dcp
MKILKYTPMLIALSVLASCGNKQTTTSTADSTMFTSANPFYAASTLEYQAPAFDKIKNSDFKPALVEGMKQQLAEMQKIAGNAEVPTFDNTLVQMEKSGQLFFRVGMVFNLLSAANTNPDLQKLQEEIAPQIAATNDAIYLDPKLFKRVATVYNDREKLKLDAEAKRLVEFYYQKFELAGANLPDSAKTSLKKLNQEEAGLSAKFNNMVLGANKAGAVLLSKKEELNGLSDGEIEAAAGAAKAAGHAGQWLLSLKNTTQQPALQSLTNRATRQKLFEASYTRTDKKDANDTRDVIARIAQIRAAKAQILGFKNYAAWKLQDQMAKTPEAVDQFLGRLIPAATARAKAEGADIQAVIDQEKGGFKLQPWDWNFYAEKVRKAKFDLDENEVKPYFEINTVLQKGVFYAANQLYGLTFEERKDLPVYQEDVRVFDVIDQDGKKIALFYCDYFKRDNKNGGAWMDNLVGQSKLLGTKPVIYNVCNFAKPAAGQPALISYEDAVTMFHEFGHGLHGIFADQVYPSISGTNTARDFVEFPSQFNEHWAADPKIFNNYAVHYKTGQPMPQALLDKIKKAAKFNQGYALTEALADDVIDMKWHTLSADAGIQDADKLEAGVLKAHGFDAALVPPRYRSGYFLHIWSNGYAAGYYAYAWTEMLDDDAFAWFKEHGGLSRANGQRFRDLILSRGNTQDLATMFRNFRGHEPGIEPMLEARGLK